MDLVIVLYTYLFDFFSPGVDRELGDDPEGRVKFEGASQEYEFSSEESEGEENNREVEHDPADSRSPDY
jgi:hypothetical protein